jgi:hypothetical protein
MALSMSCEPLTMMTSVSGETEATRGISSSPLIPSIEMSLRTSWKSPSASRRKASSAEPTDSHSHSWQRDSSSTLRTAASSSAMRRRAPSVGSRLQLILMDICFLGRDI